MGNSVVAVLCAGAVTLTAGLVLAGDNTCFSPPSVLASFVSGQEIPESVTADKQGNLYVSVGNTIRRREPGGQFSVFATLPLPINALGVKVGPDGCVYNASTSLSAVPGAFVWKICGANSVEVFTELDPAGGPNDLAFDDHGDLFVTDPVLGRIWRVDQTGNAQVFAQHPRLLGDASDPALVFRPVGVNGIAFQPQQRALYVSNTDQGSILRIDLRAANHTPTLFARSERLRGADGIAFDREGTLFVAVNALDSLVTVSRNGQLRVALQGGLLDAPSSIVFGSNFHDQHELFLMSSAFSRTLGFQSGTPQPALLKARITTPGLPLL